jgi:hypothetical protein
MSWNRIVLPLNVEICPDTVKIGEMAWDCYRRANEPAGFALFHATDGPDDGDHDRRIVYFSPVASEVCREISEVYPFEPCRPPARDESNIAYVFGDPRMMGQLRDSVDTDRLVFVGPESSAVN